MDTSGLATGLSLGAFLLAFAYLSLVEYATAGGSTPVWPVNHLARFSLSLRLLRLTCAVASAISALSLVLGRGVEAVAIIAVSSLALLAFLVMLDRTARLFSSLQPRIASGLAFPIQTTVSRILSHPGPASGLHTEPGPGIGNENNGYRSEAHNGNGLVITEEEQATLDTRERLMIRSILRLDESVAREVMVPRVDVVAVEANTPLPEVASRIVESGHSRLPVYSETIDNILGVVYSRDLLPFLTTSEAYPPLESILRPAYFIPESKRLDELLKELQEKRVHMAMVVDEYGGIEGLVTLEDLLEEIVGEIEDEFSGSREPRVVPLANGDIIADARVTLDYVSDLLSIPIESEDVDTLGGVVYSALGKMPQVGDEVVYDGLRLQVVSLLGRRIRQLRLSRAETK